MNEVKEGIGVLSNYFLPICVNDHVVTVSPIPSQTYGSTLSLESSSKVNIGSDVLFQSQATISLESGFEVKPGGVFQAEINMCGN